MPDFVISRDERFCDTDEFSAVKNFPASIKWPSIFGGRACNRATLLHFSEVYKSAHATSPNRGTTVQIVTHAFLKNSNASTERAFLVCI
jgi:hypothetical protein